MKVNKRGIVVVGVIVIVLILMFVGCVVGNSGDEIFDFQDGGKFVVWVDVECVDVLQGVVDVYEEKIGVKVEFMGKLVDDMKDDFIQQVLIGKGFDIVMGVYDWLGEFSINGVVVLIEFGDSFEDYFLVVLQVVIYEGIVYMFLYVVENIVVLCNVDFVLEVLMSFDDMVLKGMFVVEQGVEGNLYYLYFFQMVFGVLVFGMDEFGSYDLIDFQLGSEGGFVFVDWLGVQGVVGMLNIDIDGEIVKQQFFDGIVVFWLIGLWNVGVVMDVGINVVIDLILSLIGEIVLLFVGVKGFFVSFELKNKVVVNDFFVNYFGIEDVQFELFKVGNVLFVLIVVVDFVVFDLIIVGFQVVGVDVVLMFVILVMGLVWQFWGVVEVVIINGVDLMMMWQKFVDDVIVVIK